MGTRRTRKSEERAERKRRGVASPTMPIASAHPAWSFGALLLISAFFFRDVFLHPTEMLWGSDLVRLHTTLKAAQFAAVHDGRFPLWDPTAFAGRSIVGDPVAGVLNPLAWSFWITSSPVMFGYYLWAYVTLGAIGMWLWMRWLNADPMGSLLAAIAFAFSGRTAGHLFAGHLELLPGMLCLPWVLWASERLLQRRSVGRAIVLGGVLCITATMGSVQSLYWHMRLLAAYVPIRAWRGGGWGRARSAIALLVVAAGAFALGGMAWWLPVVRQTLLLSARAGESGGGYDFATMASAAPSDLARLIWPFAGIRPPVPFASDPENGFFWESASYPGLVTLALALALIVLRPKDGRTIGFGLAALLALDLSLGRNTPLYRLAYDVVPGFAMFRAPGRLLFYANLFLAAMAGFGLGELLRASPGRRWAVAGVSLILLAIALTGPAPVRRAPARLLNGPQLAILTSIALLASAVLFATRRVATGVCSSIIIALSVLDLGVVWTAHLVTAPADQILASNSVVEFLAARQQHERSRIYDPTGTVSQPLAARHGLELIDGYHPGIYRHQLELYKALWPAGEGSSLLQLLPHSPHDIACTPVLDLLNTRYVVAYEAELDDRFVKVFSTPPSEPRQRNVFERKEALPRAFVVPRGMTTSGDDDPSEFICQQDPRAACLWDAADVNGTASFQGLVPTREEPGDLVFDFETEGTGVLVVSESWHPDWVATDSGMHLAVHRANHGILGLPLAAGRHQIHLWYRPWDFYLGVAVSGVFWLAVLLTSGLRRFRPAAAVPTAVPLPPISFRS